MNCKVSKFKNTTFEIQIIQKQPLDAPHKKATLKNFSIRTGEHPQKLWHHDKH